VQIVLPVFFTGISGNEPQLHMKLARQMPITLDRLLFEKKGVGHFLCHEKEEGKWQDDQDICTMTNK
jgi:hypothetical protein